MQDKAKGARLSRQSKSIGQYEQLPAFLSRETQCRTSQHKRKCEATELTKREYLCSEVNSATTQIQLVWMDVHAQEILNRLSHMWHHYNPDIMLHLTKNGNMQHSGP